MQPADRLSQLTETSLSLLRDLVAFNTVSSFSNLPVIEYIERYLTQRNVISVRIPSPDGKKCNLLARIGAEVAGGIILSGHTDVVPVEGQSWDTDPFSLTEKDGKLYGRGTADMKSFLAICLALVPEWLARPLEKPIYLAFSYDEEVGCLGVPHMLDYIAKHIPRPAFALIGEPTLMQVATAHKGVWSFETTVHGLEFHSSQPQRGVNAVQIGCELVHFLTQLAQDMAKNGAQDARFSPAYSTLHVGTIAGGTARNIIAKHCSFQWEIRPLPGFDPTPWLKKFEDHCNEIQQSMRRISTDTAITTRPMSHMNGVTLSPGAEGSCSRIMHAARSNEEHVVAFGTEAGVFLEHGIPAIICGPGSIDQAHKPNEWIDKAQIPACVEFLLRLTQ